MDTKRIRACFDVFRYSMSQNTGEPVENVQAVEMDDGIVNEIVLE